MTAPAWVKWVRPAPDSQEELQDLVVQFDRVAGNILNHIRIAEEAKALEGMKSTRLGLLRLPAEIRDLPETQHMVEILAFRIDRAKSMAPTGRGGYPVEIPKRYCLAAAATWLHGLGKEWTPGASGTVPGLAMELWNAAATRGGISDTTLNLQGWVRKYRVITGRDKTPKD